MVGLAGPLAYLANVLTLAMIFAVLALGLNLQWGYTGLFNVSIAAFWGIGAYTVAIVAADPGGQGLGLGLPIWVGFLVATVVAAVVAVLIGIPTLELREDYLAIATLGLAETIRLILLNERWLTQGGQGMSVANPLTAMDFTNLLLLLLALGLLVATYWVVERTTASPWGRVLQAIREDEEVTRSLGKDSFAFKMESLVLGSMIMAVAGGLMALRINYLIPRQFVPEWTFYIWIAVIIGGAGNNRGAVLGGFMLAALFTLPRFLQDYLVGLPVDGLIENFRLLSIGILLIVILTFRPQGILGEKRPGES